MKLITKMLTAAVVVAALLAPQPANATKFLELKVVDKDYLMVHFRDGEVHYRDDATGPSAYKGHSFAEGDDTLVVFGTRLETARAAAAADWAIASVSDRAYGKVRAQAAWRKSKPMNTDNTLTSELDHWIFLKLPKPMKQGCTYTVTFPEGMGSDVASADVVFDIWNSQSESVHVNIIGYSPAEKVQHADLYLWLGDGGQRDYKSFEGRKVYLYNVATGKSRTVGKVKFWKSADASAEEATRQNMTGSDVWNIDFKESTPGRYRLVVDGVGCSMDFDIAENIFFEPYRYSVRGYYYMRLGEPIDSAVIPVPRQPQFIPETDPVGFTVYKTDLQPWSPEWRRLGGDVWDEPHFKPALQSAFWQHRLPGNPVNTEVRGGHSDAFDWDRHLAHVSNIYDLLLPYILTGGRINEDNLSIRESGNGIPDIIDEARNEVDFFLSIRDGEAYSQGVTNPSSDWTVMYQAGCTTMAAWANAANCAILAEAFRIDGNSELCSYYTNEAIKAYYFASRQENSQLDDTQDIGSARMRGRDFRQMAAAFLYNVTGDTKWEDAMASDSVLSSESAIGFSVPQAPRGFSFMGGAPAAAAPAAPAVDYSKGRIFDKGMTSFYQIWGVAAYLACPHERHYPELYARLVTAVNYQADSNNVLLMAKRPSRRAANDSRWQVSENLQLVMMAHYLAVNSVTTSAGSVSALSASARAARIAALEEAMYCEASWGLGRNPGNIVEMTGLGERHITDCYSTGRNDGVPGTHPGQTPFNGTETWSPGHNGGDARLLTDLCYPSWNDGGWPRQESFFNQRYFWVNGEFTPRETMRGKMALLGYLYGIRP